MQQIDLTRWRRRVVLGSAGHIRLEGDGVAPKHTAIVVVRNGDGEAVQLVRPLDGRVVVRRRGRELSVFSEWPLADGDVVVIAGHRLRYRNLDCPPEASTETGGVEWMQ